jgi:endogenous inhibitor of DNA gyrase (YacG/DUF329 family)
MKPAVSPPRCPSCRKEVAPRATNRAFPFCSMRCRQVDLGKWLGEEYRVPERALEEREDERAPDPERGPFDA